MQRWQPPREWRRITTLESHAAGEPLRIVTGGIEPIPGRTMLEKRRFARAQLDGLRRALMFEPRGHADMYGAIPTEPVTPDGDVGVLFMHNEGWSTMCGHGVIALVTVALEVGLLSPRDVIRLDTPAGRVTARPRREGTRVRRIRREGSTVRIITESAAGAGEVRAGQVVLALNAWAAGWRPFRRSLVTWSSWMVRTEPIPALIEERLGWTGGESIVDARLTVHYFHVTRVGRIAFGAGGGRPGYDGRIGRSFVDDLASGRRAAAGFRRIFPQLADVRLTDMWGGPIDVGADHLPRFGTLAGGRIHFGFGYSGNGVAPSHLGGRILAGLALGSDEPVTHLPLVGGVPRRFPPEPFRFVGARILREALIRREDGEEDGREAGWALRELTRLPRRLGFHLGPES